MILHVEINDYKGMPLNLDDMQDNMKTFYFNNLVAAISEAVRQTMKDETRTTTTISWRRAV